MSSLVKLPFSRQIQSSIGASIELMAGLPATDFLANTAPVYDDNPQKYMARIAEALEYLRLRQPGLVTLSAGVGTVANTAITANSIIFTQRKTAAGTVGVEYVFAVSAGVGFTITSKAADGSTETLDTSVLAYQIFEPAATAATPTVDIGTGSYANNQTVTISSATPGVTFRFTTDGSTPSATAGSVTGPTLVINGTTVLKVIAVKDGLIPSAVLSQTYTLTAATPTALVAAGSYGNDQTVALSTTTTGAQIRYTVDGSTPSATVGTLYTGAFTVGSSLSVKAIAYKTGYSNSAVLTAAYVLTVATPAATPAAGTFVDLAEVTLASSTTGTAIYYTVDGSTPDNTDTLYDGGVLSFAATTTLKAIGYKTGYTTSAVLSATYTIT